MEEINKNIRNYTITLSIVLHLIILALLLIQFYQNKKNNISNKNNIYQINQNLLKEILKTQEEAKIEEKINQNINNCEIATMTQKGSIDGLYNETENTPKKNIEFEKEPEIIEDIENKKETQNESNKINIQKDLPKYQDNTQNNLNINKEKRTIKSVLNKEKKIIIPNITKGYPNLTGNDGFNIQGNSNQTNNLGFKVVSYIKKITNILQNNTNARGAVYLNTGYLINPTVTVNITVDRSGNLISVEKLISSSNKFIDDFFIEDIIKKSSPFPPIPNHLQSETFSCKIDCIFYTNQNALMLNL